MRSASVSELAERIEASLERDGVPVTGEPIITGSLDSAPAARESTQQLLDKAVRGDFDKKPEPAASEPPAEQPAEPARRAAENPALPQSPEAPDILGYAKTAYPDQAGIFDQYQSTDAMLQAHAHLRRKLSERDQDAAWAKQARENPAALVESLKRHRPDLFPDTNPREPAKTPPNAPAQPKPHGFKPEWTTHINPNAPPEVLKEIDEWYRNQQIESSPVVQQLREQLTQLGEQLKQETSGLAKPEDIDNRLGSALGFEQGKSLANDYIARNRESLFVRGDAKNGLTAVGRMFFEHARVAEEQRGFSTADALDYAENIVWGAYGRKQGRQPNGNPNTAAAVQRGNHKPPEPTAGQRKPGEGILETMERLGFAGS